MVEIMGPADAAREEMNLIAENFRILARSNFVPTRDIDHRSS
jgi:hypothetical protein